MKQISADESGGATFEGAAFADAECAQAESVFSEGKRGVTAADTAAFVPSLSASRRVILLVIRYLIDFYRQGLAQRTRDGAWPWLVESSTGLFGFSHMA
jgi:hypothetical protein